MLSASGVVGPLANSQIILALIFLSFFYISVAFNERIEKENLMLRKLSEELIEKVKLHSKEKVKILAKIDREKFKKDLSALSSLGRIKQYNIVEAIAIEIEAKRIKELVKFDSILKVDLDRKVKAFLQESIPLINASKTWKEQVAGVNLTGKDIAICIIDSGVDYTHPDLGGCFGSNCKVVAGYDFVDSDNDPIDDYGHGTHVAGIAAANGSLKGVAPDAKIVAIKSLNSLGEGSLFDIISGIEWCTNNASLYNISVISMSLGIDGYLYEDYCDNADLATQLLSEAINAAVQKNISIVASTGNDYNLTHIAAPACLSNVSAVAAVYDAGINVDKVTDFSNRNNVTDFLAPGAIINSTYLSNSYAENSGTSMATPHVAGALALLYQKYKLMYRRSPTPNYLKQILNETGVKINDTEGTKLNFTRIDVLAALNAIEDTEEPKWFNLTEKTVVEGDDGIIISAYWKDNAGLMYAWLSTNESGEWKNYTGTYGSPIVFSSSSGWSNFTWQNLSLSNGTVVAWKIYANDTSGNVNVTEERNFTLVDTKGPYYFNLTTSDNTYWPGKEYQLNITWRDFSNVSVVIFEWNETNETSFVINSIFENVNVTKKDLAAGSYSYRWYANDSFAHENSTLLLQLNVTKANSSLYINLDLNGTTNQNKNYTYPAVINATAWKSFAEGNLTLYRNCLLYTSPSPRDLSTSRMPSSA